MDALPKVTVIIPVYGTGEYIERCARSLFEQTLKEIEYLFINDCTPDGAIDILMQTLEDYPYRKNQVRIITMDQNSGQAAVRERGMREAKGEYQIHCDSDDWVEVDMYEKMYLLAVSSKSDIVSSNFVVEKEGNSRIVEVSDNPDPRSYINNDFGNAWWSLCCKLFRSQLIRDNNVYPIPGLDMWEDIYVSARVYYYANHVSHIAEPLYHYDVNRDGMITKRRGKHLIRQKMYNIMHLEEFFNSVMYNAEPLLESRKCMVKSEYLRLSPIDYTEFRMCFPATRRYVLKMTSLYDILYKVFWECAANGIVFPSFLTKNLKTLFEHLGLK